MRLPPTPRRGYLILWWIFDLLGVSVTVLGLVGGAPAQGWGRIEPISFFASVLQAASIKSRQQLTLQGYYTAIRFAVDTQRRYIKGLDGPSRAQRETPSRARPEATSTACAKHAPAAPERWRG